MFVLIVVAAVTLLVVGANIYSYKSFMLVVFGLSILFMGHTWAYFPETLKKRKVGVATSSLRFATSNPTAVQRHV